MSAFHSILPTQLTFRGKCLALILLLLPVALFLGHWWTRGTIWNHVTHTPFSPWKNYLSDYAYRSPVWGIFVGSMWAFAAVLGTCSLRFFRWSGKRDWLAWPLCVLLGYASLKLVEVAVFPVKAPEVTIEELQLQMDKSTWSRLKDDVYRAYLKLRAGKIHKPKDAWSVVEAFQSNSQHLTGIRPAMIAVAMSMVLSWVMAPALFLSRRRRWLSVAALGLVIVSAPSLAVFGAKVGLGQKVGFVGVYLWMWQMLSLLFRRDVVECPVEVEMPRVHE